MAQFTTRVELHKANSDDYDTLHEAMEGEGFSRTITSDDNIAYHLPEAEYDYEGNTTRSAVLNKAKAAAGKTKKEFSILVTEAKGRTWNGLNKV